MQAFVVVTKAKDLIESIREAYERMTFGFEEFSGKLYEEGDCDDIVDRITRMVMEE